MNWRELDHALAPHALFVMGVLQENEDSIGLIGARSNLWQIFRTAPEYTDGQKDPLDRWSKRILDGLAEDHAARAIYPSDGPPYAPFIRWAEESGRFWQSPTGMLVHDTAGLMVSIRGALCITGATMPEQVRPASPCLSCRAQPCKTACPVDALDRERGYDVPACRRFLDSPDGEDCLDHGCKARRACPISQSFGRDPAQSAFHMKAFHPK